jgi:hypothetical protein
MLNYVAGIHHKTVLDVMRDGHPLSWPVKPEFETGNWLVLA